MSARVYAMLAEDDVRRDVVLESRPRTPPVARSDGSGESSPTNAGPATPIT